MNFQRSVIIAELWRSELEKRFTFLRFFALFRKTTPYGKIFKNSASKVFIATPIDVLCSNFVTLADGKSAKSCVAYLTKKQNFVWMSRTIRNAYTAPVADEYIRRCEGGGAIRPVILRTGST